MLSQRRQVANGSKATKKQAALLIIVGCHRSSGRVSIFTLLEKDHAESRGLYKKKGEREEGGGRNLSYCPSRRCVRAGWRRRNNNSDDNTYASTRWISRRSRSKRSPSLSPFISYLPGFLSDLLHLLALLRCVRVPRLRWVAADSTNNSTRVTVMPDCRGYSRRNNGTRRDVPSRPSFSHLATRSALVTSASTWWILPRVGISRDSTFFLLCFTLFLNVKLN